MISGTDDRLAFVIETEARLDGLRAARTELAGFGATSDSVSAKLAENSTLINANIGAFLKRGETVNKSSLAALQAYRAEGDALSANLARLGATETEINKIGSAIARVEQRGGAATVTKIGQSLDPISNKARTAANAMTNLSFAAAGLTQGGPSTVIAIGSLTSSLAHLSTNAAIAAGASGIGAVVVVAATLIPLMQQLANQTERVAGGFGKAFGGVGDEGADRFLQLARQRRSVAETALENAPSAFSPRQSDIEERKNRKAALDEAVKDEQAAIEAVFQARRNAQRRAKEEAKQAAEEQRRDREEANKMYFDVTNQRVLAGMRGSGNQEGADILSAQIDRVNRDLEINRLKISEDEKRDLRAKSAEATEAQVTEIQNRYADKRIDKAMEESRKLDEIEKAKAKKRLDTAKQAVDAIVRTEGSVLQTMKRLALEPIIDRLEGIAAQQAVEALAAFPDFPAMAAHGAAAVAATAAAREVASWAGRGSRGGGGGAGSGGGGGSGPGSFEPRGSTAGQGSFVVNLYSENPYGEEQIQQLQWNLERASILKRGARIPPTNQLRVA